MPELKSAPKLGSLRNASETEVKSDVAEVVETVDETGEPLWVDTPEEAVDEAYVAPAEHRHVIKYLKGPKLLVQAIKDIAKCVNPTNIHVVDEHFVYVNDRTKQTCVTNISDVALQYKKNTGKDMTLPKSV